MEKGKRTVTPKTTSPKTKTVEPKTAEPKTVEQKTTSPKTVTPKTVAPKTVTPKTVAPKTVAPKPVTPKTTAPKTVSPKTTTPKTEDPAFEVGATAADQMLHKRQAKKSEQRIITKDAEYDRADMDYSGGSKIDPSVIDNSVFDDDVTDEPVPTYHYRSMTIDHTLLSREAATGRRKSGRRRKQKTVDLTMAERYDPDPDVGLSSEVVQVRCEQGYDNFVKKKSGKSYLSIFVTNIFTFFNILTFIVAAALLVVGAGATQLFFIVIICANVVIGIFQEIRSKMKIDKLSLVSAPSAVVIRDGERCVIPTADVVLDDIICFEMGKQICTDSVVVRGECEVNESMLTGESEPVKKRVGDILYSGSFLSSGSVVARVDKVGAANYVETLTSHAKKYRKPKSELMSSIKLIIKALSPFIIAIGALMVWIAYRDIVPTGGKATYDDWNRIVTGAAGSIIGMIPSGMFLLTSLALAASVLRLARKQTLVQDLYCIEMLARVDVLCLDKTGTITDGSMEVNNVIEIKGFESDYSLAEIIGSMLTATGDNNQTALALANKFGYSKALNATSVMPFSSQRKLSAVTFEGVGTFMLGAPEFVLKDMGVRIERLINENASNGFRVMVLAHSPADIVGEKLPAVRRPVCLLVIEDHIREDAVETIRWFKENNVAVKVISGDNPMTVSEVARRVGVENAEMYVSLEGFSDQDVIEAANKYTVFGRVTPEQKRLLICSIKSKNHTVAMTGDGVNDILAMREADCSVAMASGAEAARNVSHLVLLNNDFTSMPDVVMEGRRVVNNIQASSAMFLMKTFMSIVLSIIFLAMQKTYPLATNNLMALEVCIIGIPSFFLALQGNKNIIRGKFLSNVISRAVPGGVALVLGVMSMYMYNVFFHLPMTSVDKYPPQLICMMVVAITCVGMMVLFRQCEPFNTFRTVLMICVVALTAAFIYVMPDIGIVMLDFTQVCFCATVVLASYFVVTILTKILSAIKFK
ncbi:MAG: HAD-IC family P-type ATPase [Clostridiales bacterium]|nr:HAD-IC family P-type ATPase [Clostridiales bacterium]